MVNASTGTRTHITLRTRTTPTETTILVLGIFLMRTCTWYLVRDTRPELRLF